MTKKNHLSISNWIPAALGILFLALLKVPSTRSIARSNDTSSPPGSAITFDDIRQKSGLDFILNNSVTSRKYSIETMAGGVALFDYNNDGWLDIFFTNGARLPEMDKSNPEYFNRLFRNNGDGTFADVTSSAGIKGTAYAMGVAAGDYDNDGFVDLYVTGVNQNQLLHNNGNGTFTDVTLKSGTAGIHPKIGKLCAITAGWFDYNNDGKLDLFVNNYLLWSIENNPPCHYHGIPGYCHPREFQGTPNILYRNNGDGTFTDVSGSSHIGDFVGKGMGLAFADYDRDGWMDVFVSNDNFRNFLFHNKRDGTFEEVGIISGVSTIDNGSVVAGMGADFRDLDNDGYPDIFQTAMYGDTFPLFKNLGDGFFNDIREASGIARQSSRLTAWGNGIIDFDNDGFKDLFTANAAILDTAEMAHNLPSKLPNALFRNAGNGTFQDVSLRAGREFINPSAHRGTAFGDFNNDGRIDIVVTSLNSSPQLFKNNTMAGGHWLLLQLVGGASNRDGVGAQIKITTASGSQYNQVTTAVGYNSSSDKRVHFGLGKVSKVDRIEIQWPSGIHQVLADIKSDQILMVNEPGKPGVPLEM
jgi:enediyne biosynthesis protein E4